MRSKVAEELRREQIEQIRLMTVTERLMRVREASELAIALYMAGQKLDRDAAVNAIRRDHQNGRRYSRCMIESLK